MYYYIIKNRRKVKILMYLQFWHFAYEKNSRLLYGIFIIIIQYKIIIHY